MSKCECPLAGFCDRHLIDKHEGWHKLCQDDALYREAWDAFRGPGQFNLKAKPLDRITRIKKRVAKDRRIEGWIRRLRTAEDTGLGDTVVRLKKMAKSEKFKTHLTMMLKLQACKTSDAVQRLNAKHRYDTGRPPMDGRMFQMDIPPTIPIQSFTGSNRCIVVIAPDAKPQAELAITGPLIRAYASRCGADYREFTEPVGLNHACANKYVATQVARYYDQTMLIDTDIVPMPNAPDMFAEVPIGKWGLVDDLPRIHQCGATEWMESEWRALCRSIGDSTAELRHAWNSGLMIMPNDADALYHPPIVPVPNTWCVEQHYHTYMLLQRREQVVDLPLIWQAGFPWNDYPSAIKTSHFIHVNGVQGPHSVRLAFLRHFATGARTIPAALRNLVRNQPWTPWWAR
jgi:hypothetical protein